MPNRSLLIENALDIYVGTLSREDCRVLTLLDGSGKYQALVAFRHVTVAESSAHCSNVMQALESLLQVTQKKVFEKRKSQAPVRSGLQDYNSYRAWD